MPLLLDLANETLYHIIKDIHPNDILNFSLCRKDVHLLTKETLQEHKSWQHAYTHVVLHGCHRHQNDSHPLQLIRDICTDWRIGEFPTSLTVECCDVDENESDTEGDDEKHEAERRKDDTTTRNIMQDIESHIQEKATKLQCLLSIELDDLCSLIKRGYRAAMIGLLLFFLPNLKTVCLHSYTWNASKLSELLDTIACRELRRQPPRSQSLTKLSQIQVLGSEQNAEGEDLEFLLPFATLPSMRSLVGNFVVARDNDDVEWHFGFRVSDVTEMVLQNSAVGIKLLRQLFFGVRGLKRFTYSHNRILDNHSMKAHEIIGALLEHARDSLEYLALTGHCDMRDSEQDKHYNNGSLQGFKALNEVCLHSAIYVDQVSNDVSMPAPDGSLHGVRSQDAIRALVDILPPSIETVKLLGRDLIHHLGHLLANLWEQKHLRLPKLNNLTIIVDQRSISSLWVEPLTGLCNNIGVTLEVGSEEG